MLERPHSTAACPLPAAKNRNGAAPLRIVAYDYGIKQNILRRLTSFGCKVRRLPGPAVGGTLLRQHVAVEQRQAALLHHTWLQTAVC